MSALATGTCGVNSGEALLEQKKNGNAPYSATLLEEEKARVLKCRSLPGSSSREIRMVSVPRPKLLGGGCVGDRL